MTSTVLSIGECMVELSPRDGDQFALNFAGDTFNTAWYLRQCAPAGVQVGYLSAVGDDEMSRRMAGFIADAGIIPHLAVIPGRTVGLYLISLSKGERSFSYWRSTSAARDLAHHLDPLDALGQGDMAYVSGITLAILPEPDRALLLDRLGAARARGVRVAFDPNLRPRLWRDTDEMCGWIMRAAAVCDIALPSHEDEATFFGDADPAATLERYRSAGAGTVAVKDGAKPVLACAGDGAAVSVQPDVNPAPVDTTAAGDSFNAAFLAGLLRGDTVEAAAAAGCALSARVVGHQGALMPAAAS